MTGRACVGVQIKYINSEDREKKIVSCRRELIILMKVGENGFGSVVWVGSIDHTLPAGDCEAFAGEPPVS